MFCWKQILMLDLVPNLNYLPSTAKMNFQFEIITICFSFVMCIG